MPALSGPFDEIFSSNKLDIDDKAITVIVGDNEAQLRSTSLHSLVGLKADGEVCRGGINICYVSI